MACAGQFGAPKKDIPNTCEQSPPLIAEQVFRTTTPFSLGTRLVSLPIQQRNEATKAAPVALHAPHRLRTQTRRSFS